MLITCVYVCTFELTPKQKLHILDTVEEDIGTKDPICDIKIKSQKYAHLFYMNNWTARQKLPILKTVEGVFIKYIY